jgi:hypothetical protein
VVTRQQQLWCTIPAGDHILCHEVALRAAHWYMHIHAASQDTACQAQALTAAAAETGCANVKSVVGACEPGRLLDFRLSCSEGHCVSNPALLLSNTCHSNSGGHCDTTACSLTPPCCSSCTGI